MKKASSPRVAPTQLLVFALCFALAAPIFAQDSQTTPASAASPDHRDVAATFSVNVKVVNVLASVRDKHGEIVRDLRREDFALLEDGRPQNIKYFAQQSEMPLTLGLLVDTSLSQIRLIDRERAASEDFFAQVLRETKDKAFVIHFDHEVELLQDLTSSRDRLEAAIRQLDMSGPDRDPGPGGGPYGRGGYPGGGGGGHPRPSRRGGGTLLYDAVFLGSDELMQKQQGRKAMIILTDGVDQGSQLTLQRAIEAAQRSDTLVYAVLFSDPDMYSGGSFGGRRHGGWGGRHGGNWPQPGSGSDQPAKGKKVLQQMARETGGRFFEVSRNNSIEDIYRAIDEELRNQYSLGYSSDRPPKEAEYRKIEVKAKRPDVVVQARDGYYAQP